MTTAGEAAGTLVFKVIAVCTLTALLIGRVAAQLLLPTPSTLAAGRIVRAPNNASIFVKKIEFVQDYVQVEGLTFLVHAHSMVRTRLIGRVVLDIYHRDYQTVARPILSSASKQLLGRAPPLLCNVHHTL